MLPVQDGKIRHPRVKDKIFWQLEHGPLRNINGIILHQTSSNYTLRALLAYEFRLSRIGAHFLIAPDGTIYQTARINQICWHVGHINSRCYAVHSCAPDDMRELENIIHQYGEKSPKTHKMIDAREQKKHSHLRYPNNEDSIGIELVGAPVDEEYQPPTPKQNQAAQWLIRELQETLKINRNQIFSHGETGAGKVVSEGTKIKY